MITLAELTDIKACADGKKRQHSLIDSEVEDRCAAESTPCPTCHGKRRYVAIYDAGLRWSYAICDKCEIAEEF